MLEVLESIYEVIVSLAVDVANFFITAVNGLMGLFGTILAAMLSVLPGFPARPHLEGLGIEWLVWFLPLEAMLAAFALMLAAWIVWMGYTIIAKKIGVIS
jgi:hypothetical protein